MCMDKTNTNVCACTYLNLLLFDSIILVCMQFYGKSRFIRMRKDSNSAEEKRREEVTIQFLVLDNLFDSA